MKRSAQAPGRLNRSLARALGLALSLCGPLACQSPAPAQAELRLENAEFNLHFLDASLSLVEREGP